MAEKKIHDKILTQDELAERVRVLKEQGKTVVQTHGVFDLVHPGIIKHITTAKEKGDVLVVTVIMDRDVRRGHGRPVFPEELRAENVASLQQVDYVSIVSDERPFECVQAIRPDVFARGQAYKERDRKIHRKIFEEEKELYFGKTKICETEGFSFSSSQIINNFLDIYPPETKSFLRSFSDKYSFSDIEQQLNDLKDLRVLLIGDGIIDEYHYCESMRKSAKAHLVVSRFLSKESFAGGAFAIANHMAGLCDNVHLVSLLGKENSQEDFICDSLKNNVTKKFFYRDDAPTILKKRYVHQYLNQKLFEVNYLNDKYITGDFEDDVIEYLTETIPKYDLVLISDFGHGFVSTKMIEVIEKLSKKLAVNTQTNSANAGYNLVTKYSKPDFVCLDEPELRLATQQKHANIECLAKNIAKAVNTEYFIVTLGKMGSLGVDRANNTYSMPIFSSKVVDTVGAGDAFFGFTAPCFARGMHPELISFIGNAVGALAVQIVCNKKPVEKYELLEFINTMLK